MRVALVALVALVVSVPALGAGLDPSTLVLRADDVPSAFVVDREGTGVRTNEREWRDEPESRRVFQRARRVTGYESRFERGIDSIASRIDVLGGPAGARLVLDHVETEMRKSGIRGLWRGSLAIGDEGWVYGDREGKVITFVVWRHGRIFSAVVGAGVSRTRVTSLARLQQRRIAAALR